MFDTSYQFYHSTKESAPVYVTSPFQQVWDTEDKQDGGRYGSACSLRSRRHSEFNESEQARQEWTEEDDNGSSKYT